MVETNIPKEPKTESYRCRDICKIGFHFCIQSVLVIVFIIASIQVLYAYYSFVRCEGLMSENSLKYGLIILAGSYVALFIDRKKIKEFLRVKSVNKLKLGK